ncbi:MAG TPA: hypothetical protein DCQ83_01725, partial [Fibrobacteres bacterium]|nr:hypothetical protein [Fibrobacterota bacterium]
MNGRLSRLTGYACVFLVLAAVLAGAMAFAREISRPERRIQVQFSELGTLMRQDPVVQNGAIIGRVEDIHLRDGLPVADIELFRSDFIAEDSRFV